MLKYLLALKFWTKFQIPVFCLFPVIFSQNCLIVCTLPQEPVKMYWHLFTKFMYYFLSGLDKFTSNFLARPIGHAKSNRPKPKCECRRETTGNNVFCSSLPRLWFSFLMYFHCKFLQWNFRSVNVVWISDIRCLPKKNFLQTHLSKVVHKNMLKTWSFMKNNLHHGCFCINLQKIFQTNIIENFTGQMLLMVALMVDLCSDNSLT